VLRQLEVTAIDDNETHIYGQWSHEMKVLILATMACFTTMPCLLSGCGLGGTAVSAAAGGVSEAQEAKEARKTEDRVKQQLDAAAAVDAERRQAADAGTQ